MSFLFTESDDPSVDTEHAKLSNEIAGSTMGQRKTPPGLIVSVASDAKGQTSSEPATYIGPQWTRETTRHTVGDGVSKTRIKIEYISPDGSRFYNATSAKMQLNSVYAKLRAEAPAKL